MAGFREAEGAVGEISGRVVIIAARFNDHVVEPMREAAERTLKAHGLGEDDITVLHVPGAFELPLAALHAIDVLEPDAVITLGAVIRGGTPHFEYVCNECARGVSSVSLETGVPVIFGVLTTDNEEQARERSGPGDDNKGAEAALAALEMIDLLGRLDAAGE